MTNFSKQTDFCRQNHFSTMSKNNLNIIHDCEAEKSLHRDPFGSEWNFREAMRSTNNKIAEAIPADPYAQEQYNALCEKYTDDKTHERVTKQELLKFAKDNWRFRTTNPDLLVQRYFNEKNGFSEASMEIRPPTKIPPMQYTLKCSRIRKTRQENLERMQQMQPPQ